MRVALLANPDNLHVQRWISFLAGRGHDLLVIADPFSKARPEGAKVVVPRWSLADKVLAFRMTPAPHGNNLWKFLAYRPLLREFKPDVVHGLEAYHSGVALARCGPYPKVLTPWGKDIHHDAFQGPVWRAMIAAGLKAADRVSTNDPALGPYIERAFGVPASKAHPFSWGADLAIFRTGMKSEVAAWRARLGIEEGAPVIFSPRHLDPYWGAETVINAIPEVLKSHPKAVFVVLAWAAGAPRGFKADMRQRLVKAGAEGGVRWLEDRLAPSDLAAIFNLSDAFVSVPRTDLLAITLLEGMACGSFPILGDLPAYAPYARVAMPSGRMSAEMVNPHGNHEALAQAVRRVLDDPSRMREAAAFNAALMIEREDMTRNMAEMETVYQEAVSVFKR